MSITDYNKFDSSLPYIVDVGSLVTLGNARFFYQNHDADKIYSSSGGRDAVKRAARHFCQSYGVLEMRKIRLSKRASVAWIVTGTTGQSIVFRVRRNTQ